ncbi:MAG: DUF4386 domain-containing protein [Candidatus Promineifilaceae bacterium]
MSTNTIALGKAEQKSRSFATSPQKLARIAGLLYLIIIVSGIFGFFFIRQSLIVPGDAAATAANISASEGLFRISIGADLIMIVADIALALVFYLLFKPVSSGLSLMAAFFRLAQAAVLGVNLLNLFFALQLLSGADYLAVLGSEQVQAMSMLFLDAYDSGYAIGLLFFGVNLFILAYLVLKSGYLPKVLGILLLVAAVGYVIDTFARTLMLDYTSYQPIFDMVVFAPATIAEVAMALWLLIKGVKVA